MRIALDSRWIDVSKPRGIGKSLVQLYTHLAQLRPDWQVLAYCRSERERASQNLPPTIELRRIELRGDRFDAWQRWRLPMAAWRDGASLLHCPGNHCPSWMPVPTIVTIHDLIPLDLPHTIALEDVHRFARSLKTASRRAAAITCPSRYTRDRLVEQVGIEADRIHITPWGPPATRSAPDEAQIQSVLSRFRIAQPFVLHFGASEPRKNTQALIEAWAVLNQRARRPWRLLIVGLDAKAQNTFYRTCQRYGAESSVVLHGYAKETDLQALLVAAEVLAYPSLTEGFGLPILEAFASGTAVLTSEQTSLPEVAGDAALLVNPHQSAEIRHGIAQLIKEPQRRAELVRRGRSRLAQFSWQRCAQRFATAIEAAVRETGRTPRAA